MYLILTARDRRLLLASLKLLTMHQHALPREVIEMLPEENFGQLSIIGLVGKIAALREVTMSEQEQGNVLDQDREELDTVTLTCAAAVFDGTVQARGLGDTLTMGDKRVEAPHRPGIEPGEHASYPFNGPLYDDKTAEAHALITTDPDLVTTGKALLQVLRHPVVTKHDIDVAIIQFERALERVTRPFEGVAPTPVGWDVAETDVPYERVQRTTSELFVDLIASMKRDGVVFENEPPAKYLATFLAHALDESSGNGYICHADVDTFARAFESIGETLNA